MDIDALRHLVREAGFIFRGRPLLQHPGEPPPIPAGAGESVATHIDHVLRSTGALRDLAGKQAFVLTKDAALRPADAFIFFAQVLSLGQQLLVRELGRVEPTAEMLRHVEQTIREEDERPLRGRVAAAELIVVGEVVDSRILERPFPPPSEHYPDWGVDRPNRESQTARKPACTPGFLAKSITCSGQIIAIDQSLPNSSRTTA